MTKKYAFMLTAGFAFFISMAIGLSVPDLTLGGEPPTREGVQIHKSTVKGYGFAYILYHFPERNTWHLMVAVTDPEGSKVENGKVGFLVVAPDGSKQKAMAMGMKGSYGADMDFGTTGTYKIKLKALVPCNILTFVINQSIVYSMATQIGGSHGPKIPSYFNGTRARISFGINPKWQNRCKKIYQRPCAVAL